MKLSVGKKLYAAFGAVVLVMLVMVGVSIRAGNSAESGLDSVSNMMGQLGEAGEAFQSTLLVRLALADYIESHDASDFESIVARAAEATAQLEEFRDSAQSPRRQELASQALAGVADFTSGAVELGKVITEMDRLVGGGLDAIAPRLSDRVKSYQAGRPADSDAARTAVALGDSVAGMQVAAYRYLRTHAPADLDRAVGEARGAAGIVGELRDADAAGRSALDAIEADTNTFVDALRRIAALAEQRDTIVASRIDPAAQRFASARVDITESLIEDSGTTRDGVFATLAAGRKQTVVAALVAISAAVVLSVLVGRGITRPVRDFLGRFELIAKGDFTQRVECRTRDEIGDLATGFNGLIAEVGSIISGVQQNAEQVSAAATEVAATSEQMASSTEHQRAQLTQVAAAVEEMAATVTEVSGRTGEVSRQSTAAGDQAAEGGDIVRRTVEEIGQIATQVESTSAAVGQLSEKAVKIGEILTVINDIADQTNLLALNAAIEAARAGEHGRGFAVVADEVRKLAERTQEATQEVSRSIGEIQASTGEATEMMAASRARVAGGVELAERAGVSLESIVAGSTTVAQSLDSIAAAVEQQSASSSEIARSIEVISAAADESTQGANQAAAAATQLSGNAEALRELVARFKV